MVNLRKIDAILAYFSNNTNPKYLGKVKLMKLLYFLDFTHTKKYGAPVTYDTYYNLKHGPIPTRIKNLVDEAADDDNNNAFKGTIHCAFPDGIEMCQIVSDRVFTEQDEELFSETELEVLKQVSERFKDAKTQEIEDESHKESPWSETNLLDKIPYYLAAHDKDAAVSEDEIKLALL